MVRAYKETPRPIGVYRIRNTGNGRSYVGRSVDLPSILNRERAQLRLGVHPLKDLQRDWDAIGPEGFVFEILDTLKLPDTPDYDPKEDLRTLEAMWLEQLQPFDAQGYTPRPKPRR